MTLEKSVKTRKHKNSSRKTKDQKLLENTLYYEKKVYDLEQLLDIAKSFCSTLDFSNLLESIVYICLAQMHVLGAEIFVRDLISNEKFILETAKSDINPNPATIPVNSVVSLKLQELGKPVTLEELSAAIGRSAATDEDLKILERLNPTLLVPLIQKNHLNGILILQERIAIEDETTYTDYEQNMIMSIATLASVAINNASLMEMSSTDMMTHLKLKYYFFNMLTEALDVVMQNPEKHIAVLMFDIDFFKKFNDTYGHECGDFVLISVAELIKKNLRDSDVASRYGGEEFTVLLDNADKKEALKAAERIRKAIAEHDFVYNNQHLHVTISCGVSVYDSKTNPVNVANILVNQADQGLYISKNSGRNKVSLYNSDNEKAE